MKLKKLALLMAIAMMASVFLTACTPKAAVQKPGGEKTIKLSLDGEPPNADPQVGTDLNSILIGGNVLEGLTRVHDGKIQPGIAEKWEISPDGKVYTFHLRDSKWSDGTALTAKDFQYSILRLLDPKTAAGYAEVMGFYIKNGEKYFNGKAAKDEVGVKVIDEKTLEITLENPTGYFLRLLGFMAFLPSKEEMVTKYGEAYASEPEKMAFNGPFIIKQWKHEEKVVLAKNPNYWDKDKVKADIIDLPIINDSKTAINLYESGEILSCAIPEDLLDSYIAKGKAKFMPNGGLFWLQFNYSSKNMGKIMGNVNFRKAISAAIDRDALLKAVVKRGTPANRYIPDNVMGTAGKFDAENPLSAINTKADPAKAKEYFAKALKELGMTADKFPTIKLLGSDSTTTRKYCEAVQDMLLTNLGIKIELVNVPSKQRLQLVKDRDYEMVYANWFPDYDDPMTYLDIWTSKSSMNRSDYKNPAFDKLIMEAKTTGDEKTRQLKMFEAEKILLEDVVAVPSHWGSNAYIQSDKLINYTRSMTGADPDLIYVDMK